MFIAQKKKDRIVYNDSETLPSLVPNIWEFIPSSLKEDTFPEVFKNEIKIK